MIQDKKTLLIADEIPTITRINDRIIRAISRVTMSTGTMLLMLVVLMYDIEMKHKIITIMLWKTMNDMNPLDITDFSSDG